MTLKRILFIALALFSSVGLAENATVGPIEQAITGPGSAGQAAISATPKTNIPTEGVPIQSTISAPHGMGLSAEMAKISFVLKEIKVIGAEIFTCEELVEPFEDYCGQTITLGQAQEIAQKMTTRFQKEGYILTQVIIPPQHIKDGVLTLQVVAGFVDKVEITGCMIPELIGLLDCYGHRIRCSHPLHSKVLERYLLLANDIPGLSVKAVLTPSKTTPGAGDLKLVTTQKFEQGFFEINNFGSRFLGPTQYLWYGQVNSLYKAGDNTNLFFLTTMNREVNYFQLSHSEMVDDEGARYNAYARYSDSHPGFILKPLHITGIYKVGGLDVMYPIIRSRLENFYITGSFNVIDSSSRAFSIPLFNDRIRPLYVTFLYNHWDDHGVTQIEFSIHRAFKWMKASGASNISRPQGKSAFTKLYLTYSRDQKLCENFSFFTLAIAQYSFDPLLAIAQLPFGGYYVGRGYDPAEILGDCGIMGIFELRYDGHPIDECLTPQYYAFYDYGSLWNKYASSGFLHQSATSGGLGIRLKTKADVDINLFFAKPFTKIVNSLGNKHARYFFSFHYTF